MRRWSYDMNYVDIVKVLEKYKGLDCESEEYVSRFLNRRR